MARALATLLLLLPTTHHAAVVEFSINEETHAVAVDAASDVDAAADAFVSEKLGGACMGGGCDDGDCACVRGLFAGALREARDGAGTFVSPSSCE